MTFEEWMRAVNAHLEQLAGMCADDLPDWRYADAHANGTTPLAAARAAIRAAGNF